MLLGSNSNSYTVCTVSDVCVCIHILHNMETLVGKKNEKIGTEVDAACQVNLSVCHFDTHAIGCLALD